MKAGGKTRAASRISKEVMGDALYAGVGRNGNTEEAAERRAAFGSDQGEPKHGRLLCFHRTGVATYTCVYAFRVFGVAA